MPNLSDILTILVIGVFAPLTALILGNYIKMRIAALPRRLKIIAPSGESITIELKDHRTEEETADIIRRLEEFERQTTPSSSTS